MPHDRFYSEKELVQGDTLLLEGEEFHHLSRVMRARVGDILECFNGRGALAETKLKYLEKNAATLEVLSVTKVDRPEKQLIIAQGFPRQNRLDTILEKGCELGMDEIWLFPADRSEKGEASSNKQIRMRNILVNASKQCGQLWIPGIKLLPRLADWDKLEMDAFFGDVSDEAELFQTVWFRDPPKRGSIFFVGPESGFSDKEHAKLKSLGAKGVKLHKHILRTDTAPLSALALMSHWQYE